MQHIILIRALNILLSLSGSAQFYFTRILNYSRIIISARIFRDVPTRVKSRNYLYQSGQASVRDDDGTTSSKQLRIQGFYLQFVNLNL